jgi:hypothetical protein
MFNPGDFVVPYSEHEEGQIKYQLSLQDQPPVPYPWKVKAVKHTGLLTFFEHKVLLKKERFRVQVPLDKPLSDYM